ncbi:MAG: hypothetical protein Kow00121_60150 [Elainellaceae cyanobacterium]
MAEQAQQQKPFLQKVMDQGQLQTPNEAQVAANVVFRILRDMLSRDTRDRVKADLHTKDPIADMEIADLWEDTNVMVSFFSRLSPAQDLHISPGVFMLRLKQEAALPTEVAPETVAKAVFSATKDELPQARIQEVASALPNEVRQLWEQA